MIDRHYVIGVVKGASLELFVDNSHVDSLTFVTYSKWAQKFDTEEDARSAMERLYTTLGEDSRYEFGIFMVQPRRID